jgi:lysophospholipase L1-like esterase
LASAVGVRTGRNRIGKRCGAEQDTHVSWNSFVAVGDSFTEGLDDRAPGGNGYRGWADIVAAALAAAADGGTAEGGAADGSAAEGGATDGGAAGSSAAGGVSDGAGGGRFRYANLAVRGRLLGEAVREQVPLALSMRAGLVSFAAGGNDVLRRNFDGDRLVGRFDRTIALLRESGADVIVFRSADLTRRLPGRRIVGPRARILNDAVGEIAGRHGAYLVDLWADEELATNSLMWSVDRLHLSTAGHRRVAGQVLRVLGQAPDPAWLVPAAMPVPSSWPAARVADARWAARYLAPWVKRRVTGRSSGDVVAAKRPALTPLD